MTKEARNEQRKLLANFFNNIGTGIISVGVLAPIAALILGIQASSFSVATLAIVMASACFSGVSFHAIGRLFLIGYEP
jgi:predicted membrane protein